MSEVQEIAKLTSAYTKSLVEHTFDEKIAAGFHYQCGFFAAKDRYQGKLTEAEENDLMLKNKALESKLACAVDALEKIKAMECYPWIEAGDALKRIREICEKRQK